MVFDICKSKCSNSGVEIFNAQFVHKSFQNHNVINCVYFTAQLSMKLDNFDITNHNETSLDTVKANGTSSDMSGNKII